VISFARIEVGSGGLPVCPRCGEAATVRTRSTANVLVDLRRAVAQWDTGPGPNVCLCGADAFLHPELPLS